MEASSIECYQACRSEGLHACMQHAKHGQQSENNQQAVLAMSSAILTMRNVQIDTGRAYQGFRSIHL